MAESPKAASASLSAQEVRELYESLRASFAGRNEEFRVSRSRYNGVHWDAETNPAPRARYALTLNYVRTTVDKSVQMLLGQMPGIQVMPRSAEENDRRLAEKEEALLYYSWDKNQAPLVFRRVAFNQSLLRVGWVYYWWDSEAKCVRFRSMAPENVFPVYDGEDLIEMVVVSRRLTRALKRMYPQHAERIVADAEADPLFVDDPTLSLAGPQLAGDVHTGTTTVVDWYDRYGNWKRLMGNAVHEQNLGYESGSVPFIHFPNKIRGDETQPANDIDDIVELNQYLDQLVSQQADIIKKYANPTVVDYGSGQDPQRAREAITKEGGYLPARREARLEFLTWQGTPPDIQNQYLRVKEALHDLSGWPMSSYGQMVTNQSGVMTNLSMTPTVSSNAERQTVFGMGLVQLNEAILRLYEKFSKGEDIHVYGSKPKRAGLPQMLAYDETLRGSEINGWYKNRIKWPSALRTDDPLYVQNIIAQLTSQPPVLNVYDAMEMLGYENVEQMIDRLKEQLEDPRFNPQGLESAINAASALSGVPSLAPGMEGLDPGFDPSMDVGAGMGAAAQGAGNPNRDKLAEGY